MVTKLTVNTVLLVSITLSAILLARGISEFSRPAPIPHNIQSRNLRLPYLTQSEGEGTVGYVYSLFSKWRVLHPKNLYQSPSELAFRFLEFFKSYLEIYILRKEHPNTEFSLNGQAATSPKEMLQYLPDSVKSDPNFLEILKKNFEEHEKKKHSAEEGEDPLMDDFGFSDIIEKKDDLISLKNKLREEDPELYKEIYKERKAESMGSQSESDLFDRLTSEALEEMQILNNKNKGAPVLYNEKEESKLARELGIEVARVPIKNEGNCNSSLFQTAASMIEIELGGAIKVSADSLMKCHSHKHSCDPKKNHFESSILEILKDIKRTGYITESQYSKDKCSSSHTPIKSLEHKLIIPMVMEKPKEVNFAKEVQRVLRMKKALYTEIAVTPEDRFYAGGDFYDAKKCARRETNQKVLIVGLTKSHWIVQLSFGDAWGIKGYAKIPRNVEHSIKDLEHTRKCICGGSDCAAIYLKEFEA